MSQQESNSQPKLDDTLALEYRECNIGYNARDALVQDQFYKMVQTFSIFATIMLAFRLLVNTTPILRIAFVALMGVTGFLALIATLSDLESNASCKIAIRNHARHVEKLLFPNEESGFWRSLEKRNRYTEERIIKRLVKGNPTIERENHEPEKGVFVVAARLLIFAWIVIVVLVSIL